MWTEKLALELLLVLAGQSPRLCVCTCKCVRPILSVCACVCGLRVRGEWTVSFVCAYVGVDV